MVSRWADPEPSSCQPEVFALPLTSPLFIFKPAEALPLSLKCSVSFWGGSTFRSFDKHHWTEWAWLINAVRHVFREWVEGFGFGRGVRSLRWGFNTEIRGCCDYDCRSVSCGLCKTGVTACLPIKTRGDEEIKVPDAMWADAHKSAAIGSQGSVEMRSCKNIFSSLTCHPWSRDA